MRWLIVLLVGCFFLNRASSIEAFPREERVFSDLDLKQYDGAKIQEIHIHGLRRTQETAVRWLLGGSEGDIFSATRWVNGLNKLFNTVALYDIQTEVVVLKPSSLTDPAILSLHVKLKDKWTLLPFLTLQGGGGVYNFGGGVFDTNLTGYYTYLAVGFALLNREKTYEVTLYQEWIGPSDYQAWIDISRNGSPIDILPPEGNSLGQFTWIRNQQEFMLGRRFPGIRSMVYFDLFNDQLTTGNGIAGATLYSGQQYRVSPNVIIGRVNLSNYLQHGSEFSLSPNFTNFFSPDRAYFSVTATFKNALVVNQTDNFAYALRLGVSSAELLPYQFRLGGFDAIRGFATTRFMGPFFLAANFEYRPRLAMTRLSLFDLDLLVIQGALFTDIGWMSGGGKTPLRGTSLGLWSAGAGIRLNLVRFANCIVRFDVAKTITPNDGLGFAFGVGQFF